MLIIDAHNHVWPDRVAGKALAGAVPDMALFGDGTTAGLATAQDEAGIDRSVCLAIANSPERVEAANQYIGSIDRSRFIPFGTVHPDLSPDENLAGLRKHGVHGVKLHPVFQRYQLDDRRLLDVLAGLEGELPVIIHVGEGGGSDGTACTPAMLKALALALPGLSIIACHFGGYHRLAEASEHVLGLPVYLDTSWPPSLATLDPATVREIIRRHGVERVVFSSDWPTASPAAEVRSIRNLGLDEDETNAILGGNMARLLGL
jgi:predicted TIM-barrel fold metal-dependent hydrolase